MADIFISYRRDDTLSATGRLADLLAQRFGPSGIFRDVETIEAGADIRTSVIDAVRAARVMLLVIGRRWATTTGSDGRPRLYDDTDYVRLEIEEALARDVLLVPVLVEGARMPDPKDLPASIRAVAHRNAFTLGDSHWHRDAGDLVTLLTREADIHPSASSPERAEKMRLARAVARYAASMPLDIARLLYEPRRFLVARGSAGTAGLLQALVVLISSQALAGMLIIQAWPTSSSLLKFAIIPAVMVLLTGILLSVPLYLAWRISGAPPLFARVLVILLYQSAFVGLAFSVMVVVLLTAASISAPGSVDELARNPSAGGALQFLEAVASAPSVTPYAMGVFVNRVIAVGLFAWFLGTWTSFGEVLHQSRARSWMALGFFVLFCAIPLWGLARVAGVFSRAGM